MSGRALRVRNGGREGGRLGIVLPFSLILGELAGRLPIGMGRAILPLVVVLVVRHGDGAGARQRVCGFIALCFSHARRRLSPPRWLIKTRQPQRPFQEHTHGALAFPPPCAGGRTKKRPCLYVCGGNWVVIVIIDRTTWDDIVGDAKVQLVPSRG